MAYELSKLQAIRSDAQPRIMLNMLGSTDALEQVKQFFQVCNLWQGRPQGISFAKTNIIKILRCMLNLCSSECACISHHEPHCKHAASACLANCFLICHNVTRCGISFAALRTSCIKIIAAHSAGFDGAHAWILSSNCPSSPTPAPPLQLQPSHPRLHERT